MSDPNDLLPPALRMAATKKPISGKTYAEKEAERKALAKVRCQPRDDVAAEELKRQQVLQKRHEERRQRSQEDAERRAQQTSQEVMDSSRHRAQWQREPSVSNLQTNEASQHSLSTLHKKLEKVEKLMAKETVGSKEHRKYAKKRQQYESEIHQLEEEQSKAEARAAAAEAAAEAKRQAEQAEAERQRLDRQAEAERKRQAEERRAEAERKAEERRAEAERKRQELLQAEAKQLQERAAAIKAKRASTTDDKERRLEEFRQQRAEKEAKEARAKDLHILQKKLAKLEGMICDAEKAGKDTTKLFKKKKEYLGQLQEFDEWNEAHPDEQEEEQRRQAEEKQRLERERAEEAREAKRREEERQAQLEARRLKEKAEKEAAAEKEARRQREAAAAAEREQRAEAQRQQAAEREREEARRQKEEAEDAAAAEREQERRRQREEEERQRREEAEAEERRQREADAAAEERRRREADAAAEERRRREADAAAEERRRREAEAEAEAEEQRQKEAEERRQKEAEEEQKRLQEAAQVEQEEGDEEEEWDLVRVIPKRETIPCRSCGERSVATWASNLAPDDKWDMCEDCQETDFGGWPEGVDPVAEEDRKEEEALLQAARESEERERKAAAEREAVERAERERLEAERRQKEEEERAQQKSQASQDFLDRRAIPEPHSENTKKLLHELEAVEARQEKLAKTLKQHGVAVIEDIPYEVAKDKIAEIQKQLQELASSTEDQFMVQKQYYALEEEMSKFVTALMLTDEWAEEQRQQEQEWEDSISAANIEALGKLRRHMPVGIRNMTEEELSTQPTPNGKTLPKALAKKFKRTNILQLVRVNPHDLERMHPSLVEGFRSTGLTLTERRALHEHLRDVGGLWQERQQDPSIERKSMWFQALKSKFKEMVTAYDKHVKEYGLPGNHPYAKRNDPNGGGCPLLGNQCPVKADSVVSYDDDYGFTPNAVYEQSEAAKSSNLTDSEHAVTKGATPAAKKRSTNQDTKAKDDELRKAIQERLSLSSDQSDIDQKLLKELFFAEKRSASLEKQLTQNGLALPKEDIPYAVAKVKVAEITEEIKVIAGKMAAVTDMKEMAVLEKDYSKLSDELEKYNNALMLTKEWAQEQVQKALAWEEGVRPANQAALRAIRSHMPVNIKDLSEQDMIQGMTPNGLQLPPKMVRKFKRTNILQLVRMPPSAIEPMHASSLEALRSTGLTLTERRALHEHLKELGSHWKAAAKDKMAERKWMWHESLRSKFKELVDKYQQHVDQYGPPGNHPYAKRGESGGGCPLIGKQCPLKADLEVDYSGDYGFPAEAVYNVEQVKKSNLLTVEDLEKRKNDEWGYEDEEPVEEAAPPPPTAGLMASISASGGSVKAGSSDRPKPPPMGGGLLAAISNKSDKDASSNKPKPPGGLLAAIANKGDKGKAANKGGGGPPKMGGGLLAALTSRGKK